jgi:hypothetical protein
VSHSTSSFLWWIFWDRVSWTICLGLLQSTILLNSSSWVARITSAWLAVFVFFETESHYVAQGVELMILLPQPPEFWDYRCTPPYLALNSVLNQQVWGVLRGASFPASSITVSSGLPFTLPTHDPAIFPTHSSLSSSSVKWSLNSGCLQSRRSTAWAMPLVHFALVILEIGVLRTVCLG